MAWPRAGCAQALRVRLNHLLRMLARGIGQLGSAQHARHFLGALFAHDGADPWSGSAHRAPSSRSRNADRQTLRSAAGALRIAPDWLVPALSASSLRLRRPGLRCRYRFRRTPSCALAIRALLAKTGTAPASTLTFSASITRDNSPPDAMCSNCRIGSPGFVAIM